MDANDRKKLSGRLDYAKRVQSHWKAFQVLGQDLLGEASFRSTIRSAMTRAAVLSGISSLWALVVAMRESLRLGSTKRAVGVCPLGFVIEIAVLPGLGLVGASASSRSEARAGLARGPAARPGCGRARPAST